MYIAIDIGGTNIRIAKSSSLDKPSFSEIRKVKINNDYKKDLEIIKKNIEEMGTNVKGVGIGLPIVFNIEKTSGHFVNLPSWNDKPIIENFEEMFKCPVKLENDAVLAALGAAHYGNGIGKDFTFIIWGTGTGGTQIKNKNGNIKYYPFEPGHDIIVEPNGREGACGHKGDLESYAGGGSIKKHYKKEVKDLSFDEWDEVTDYFAKGIVKLLNYHPTELMIFGGGVAINQPERVKQIQEKVEKGLKENTPKMIISKLGDNAGLYGALGLLK